MSVTSSTDPVETVKDVLDAMAAGDWSNLGSTPNRIQFEWESEPSEKLRNARLSDVSVYVGSPAPGTIEQFSAGVESYEETQIVAATVWSGTKADTTNAAADIRDHFAANYWPDNSQKSNWREIAPTEEDDQRAGAFYRSGFHVISVQLVLSEKRST